MSNSIESTSASPYEVQRVRHEIKRRTLTVSSTRNISPTLLRVTLQGDDLDTFVSASFDDHIKLFFPSADGDAVMRDYTPRRFDNAAKELDIEFVMHGDGPAASWAVDAAPGKTLQIGGPRGSFIVPTAFDWHLLVGDETALPAIARRLEELPAGKQTIVIVEVEDAASEIKFETKADLKLVWLHRATSKGLASALSELQKPAGEGYAWAAGEASSIGAFRQQLVQCWGMDKSRIRASSYWKGGAAGHHETLGD